MIEERREKLIENLTNSMPVLRAMLHLSQRDLAAMLGISRQQVAAIEGKKRKMTWLAFLAAVHIFRSNEETNRLLSALGIFTDDLNDFLSCKDCRTPENSEEG
jgi:DNA-binding XRE family transcriptional regulator